MIDRKKLERYLRDESPQNVSVTDALRRYLSNGGVRSSELTDVMQFRKLCNVLEIRGLDHSEGYFHYTTWSCFVKMILGNGSTPPYRLFLGSCGRMNDVDDRECGEDVYFASFSYGKDENLAMWQVYGSPRPCESGEQEDGIRIRFPWVSVLRWFASGQGEKQALGIRGSDVCPLSSASLHFSDVGYYQQRDEDKCCASPSVCYRRKKMQVEPCGWFETLKKGGDERILFKRSGWNYENEVRLNARYVDVQSDFVAINFHIPLEAVLINPEKCILFSPWFDRERALSCLSNLAGHAANADGADAERLRSIANLPNIASKYRGCAKPICEKCGLMKK